MRLAGALFVSGLLLSSATKEFDIRLPRGFPPPVVPQENPMSAAKVELGRHLFYDVGLSSDYTFLNDPRFGNPWRDE